MFALLLQIAVDTQSRLTLYILGCQFVTADHLPLHVGQGFSISFDIYELMQCQYHT